MMGIVLPASVEFVLSNLRAFKNVHVHCEKKA
jgi:hypothetical protein